MRPRSTVAQKKEFSNLIIKFNMSRPINKFQKKKKKWGNLARSQAEWLRLTRWSSSIKTGDEVDLKRRAVRVIEALPGGRLVKIEGEVVLGPVGGKLLVCAAFDEVCCYHHNKPPKKKKIWIKKSPVNQWSIKVFLVDWFMEKMPKRVSRHLGIMFKPLKNHHQVQLWCPRLRVYSLYFAFGGYS